MIMKLLWLEELKRICADVLVIKLPLVPLRLCRASLTVF